MNETNQELINLMELAKKETPAVTEVENITLTSCYQIDPTEFQKLLDNAPTGSLTDEPEPLKLCTSSKVCADDQS